MESMPWHSLASPLLTAVCTEHSWCAWPNKQQKGSEGSSPGFAVLMRESHLER